MILISFLWLYICPLMAQTPLNLWRHSRIVPNYIEEAPVEVLEIYYGDNEVTLNELLSPSDVAKEPDVTLTPRFPFCTLIMIGDAVPKQVSNVVPVLYKFQVLHWLVGNIPGCKSVDDGEVVEKYFQPVPPAPPGTKPFRYAIFVFRHNEELDFFPYFKDTIFRRIFSTKVFMKRFNLQRADYGTFFKSQYISTKYTTQFVNRVIQTTA